MELEIMPFKKTISVLGTHYEIIYSTETETPKLEGSNAYVELYSKKIIVDKNAVSVNGIKGVENEKSFFDEVTRHEIFHAFLHEAGFRDYCEDEVLIDALAVLFPKIASAIWEIDVGGY